MTQENVCSRIRIPQLLSWAVGFLLFVENPTNASGYSLSLSPEGEGLRFFDELRLSPSSDLRSKTHVGSSVVEVTLSTPSITSGVHTNDDGGTKVYRLCHLTSILPLSDTDGHPTGHFGLFPNGAILLAMKHFNEQSNIIVPSLADRIQNCNVKLTMESQDSRRSPIAATRVLIDDVLSRNHSLKSPQPIAFVGASRSAVSAALSVVASTNLVPVISASSQSSSLDNKGIHALFGRTNAGSIGDALAAVSFLRDVRGVSHCAMLFVRDENGSASNSDFTQAAYAHKPPMESVISASFDGSNEESIQIAITQLAESGLRYFYAVVNYPNFPQVMRAARKAGIVGRNYFWMFSYDVVRANDYVSTEKDLAYAINGLTYISFDFHNAEFEDEWKTLEQDASLKEYFLFNQPKYLNLSTFTFPSRPSPWEYLAYDIVIALGIAACESEDYFFDGPALYRAFTNTSFTGASGRVSFGSTGSREPTQMSYTVNNVVANEPNPTDGTITFADRTVARLIDGKWETVHSTTYADGNNVAPLVLPQIDKQNNMIGTGALALGLTLACLVMAMSSFWGAWTILHRSTRVVQLSQPDFLIILCVGTLIMASTVIPMSLQEPLSQEALDVACMSVPWLYSIGFTLTFSALFSKTAKLNKLFHSNRRLKRIKLNVKEFMVPFMILFTSTVVILISWTVVAPLKWRRSPVIGSVDRYGREVEYYAVCKPEDGKPEWVFLVLLCFIDLSSLVVAVFENYRARKISTDHNESRFVALSIICILQAFAVGVPVLVAVYPNPTAVFVIGAIVISAMCAAVLLPLFVPKEVERREEATKRREQGNTTSPSQSKLAREWNTWQELKSKNDVLRSELEAARSPRGGSVATSHESLIYYGPHNSFWHEMDPSIDESGSDEASQIQTPWNEGFGQLYL